MIKSLQSQNVWLVTMWLIELIVGFNWTFQYVITDNFPMAVDGWNVFDCEVTLVEIT